MVFLMMYWIVGLLMIGSIFFGIVLVVGRNCVFRLVIGMMVFVSFGWLGWLGVFWVLFVLVVLVMFVGYRC